MANTYVEELEKLDELAHPTEEVDKVPPTYLQQVADEWEEAMAGPQAEYACTAAVREWEESNR